MNAVRLLVALLALVLALPALAQDAPPSGEGEGALPHVVVATKTFKPFAYQQNDNWVGFSIDLWREIAREAGWDYELYGTDSVEELLQQVEQGKADFAVAGLTITAGRERRVDFSYAFYQSGLQILVPAQGEASAVDILLAIFNPELLKLIGALLLVLLIVAHIVWLVERKVNPDFPDNYFQGIWHAFWWASVTLTTVGYGDSVPKAVIGRAFALVWMFSGIVLIAYFTASVTTVLTVQQLTGSVAGPKDLPGQKIATVAHTTASDWLDDNELKYDVYESIEAAIEALGEGEADAVVYDAPVLQHYASHAGKGQVRTAGSVFADQAYGIAMPERDNYREQINTALLSLQESGIYHELYTKWFGD